MHCSPERIITQNIFRKHESLQNQYKSPPSFTTGSTAKKLYKSKGILPATHLLELPGDQLRALNKWSSDDPSGIWLDLVFSWELTEDRSRQKFLCRLHGIGIQGMDNRTWGVLLSEMVLILSAALSYRFPSSLFTLLSVICVQP